MTSVGSKTAMIYLYVQKGPLSVWYVLHTIGVSAFVNSHRLISSKSSEFLYGLNNFVRIFIKLH